MKVIPVMDLMAGQVVRGVGGRRQEYRPIASRLTDSAEPLSVARAFRERFGLNEQYLADLDAIAGNEPAWATMEELLADGFRLWVDAGLGGDTVHRLADIGVQEIVAGLESLGAATELGELIESLGADRVVFSLDMCDGRPLRPEGGWSEPDSWAVMARAVECGVKRLLLLDLAAVGEGRGTPTLDMVRQARAAYPQMHVSTGGGVRNSGDLQCLQRAGAACVLVASALHDGKLTRAEIEEVAKLT